MPHTTRVLSESAFWGERISCPAGLGLLWDSFPGVRDSAEGEISDISQRGGLPELRHESSWKPGGLCCQQVPECFPRCGEGLKRGNSSSRMLWWGLFGFLGKLYSYWPSTMNSAGNFIFFGRRNWSSEMLNVMLEFESRHSDSSAQRRLILSFLLLATENWFCNLDYSSITIFSHLSFFPIKK